MENKMIENVDKGKNPITGNIIDLSPATEEVFVQRKGKKQVEEKTGVQIL